MQSSPFLKKRPFVVPRRQNSTESLLSRVSDRVGRLNPWLLGLLFTGFVFLSNAGLDFYMLHHHESTLATVEISDIISALVAGALFLKVAQLRRERQRAIQQRLEIISDMNHHIRNALEIISLSAHTSTDQVHVAQIRDSVDRITWALKEILPRA
jgi:hypothetical protein